MKNRNIENPAYKDEDMSIQNEEELNLAKFETGVKSHEEALKEAFAHGVETNDDLLIRNSMDMIKELGVAEYLTKSGKNEENNEDEQSNETKESAHIQGLIKEASIELAGEDTKEKTRIEKRLSHLYEKWGNVTRAITQVKFEKEEESKGRPIIPSIQCQGVVERIIRNPKDIVKAIQDRS
jgi:hypothetical protein